MLLSQYSKVKLESAPERTISEGDGVFERAPCSPSSYHHRPISIKIIMKL